MAKSGVSMKCRFPAEVWPATPLRKPCSASSARISSAASAIRAGGTQTSSTISAVPGRAQPADEAVQALADPPVELDRLVVAGELGPAERLRVEPVEHLRRRRLARLERRPRRRRRTRRAAPPTRAAAPSSTRGCRGSSWRRPSAPGRPSARPRSRRRRRGRRPARSRAAIESKWIQVSVVRGRQRHRLVDGLGDEGERALGADEQAAEDLERLVGVEERAEPIAGRVLDLELARDPLAQVAVGADLVADRRRGRRRAPARRRRSARRRRAPRCRSPSPRAARTSASATVE